jgi:hypothetical protein
MAVSSNPATPTIFLQIQPQVFGFEAFLFLHPGKLLKDVG